VKAKRAPVSGSGRAEAHFSHPRAAASGPALQLSEALLNSYLGKLDVDWKEFITGLPVDLKLPSRHTHLPERRE
jgi:hypothetical protein